MSRIAVLVPAPDYDLPWQSTFDVEVLALERAGMTAQPRAWTDPGDLSPFDLVLPLVAWGYQSAPDDWFALLDRLEADGIPVANSVAVLRWNTDKTYLEELAAAGVPTVPTRRVEALCAADIAAARRDFGPDLVIKPPISASAFGTHRIGPEDPVPDEALGATTMIQPFLRSVVEEGEYSLIYFGGRFSHAVVKTARRGDFRVQPHLGGTERPCAPPEGACLLAERALAAAPDACVYARIDLVRLATGELAVIELELIEPSLWLDHAPEAGPSFAAAIAERAGQQELA